MARGLFAILEDELSGEIVPENAEQRERVEELEAQVAQGEVAQSEGEVTEMADAIDDAVTAVEELSEVSDILENSIEENEGLTEDAAAVAEVAVESICNRLGYKPVKRIVPAMESFGATSSRLDATKYALESIKGTAVRVWEAITVF
jgi:cell division septum initiation protein DivIVA